MKQFRRERKLVEECLSGNKMAWFKLLMEQTPPVYDFLVSHYGPLQAKKRFLNLFSALVQDDFKAFRSYLEMPYKISLPRFLISEAVSHYGMDPVRLDEEMDRAGRIFDGVSMDHAAIAEVIEKSIWGYFEECLQELPEKDQLVFKLFLEGVTPDKIARMCQYKRISEVNEIIARVKRGFKADISGGGMGDAQSA